jgi:hypothetical protein
VVKQTITYLLKVWEGHSFELGMNGFIIHFHLGKLTVLTLQCINPSIFMPELKPSMLD